MKHVDLFSGIGGFALAARWMNWETIQFVEIDGYCQKVLRKNFPNVPIHGDIKTFNEEHLRCTVDIVTGGFPCQSFSLSGKGEADLSLWKQMFRVIGEIKPQFVVAENVYGLLTQKKGMAFECVCSDLEGEGYEVQSYLIPACAVNAPHRRDRVWFVAHSVSLGRSGSKVFQKLTRGAETISAGKNREAGKWKRLDEYVTNPVELGWSKRRGEKNKHRNKNHERTETGVQCNFEGFSKSGNAPNANSQGLEVGQFKSNGKEFQTPIGSYNQWEHWPTKPGVCRGDDGIPNRVDRIKSLGNAIVPQVVFEIFKAIEQCETPST